MNALLHMALSNAVLCGVMAVLLLPLARLLRRPAVTHALCVLTLLKLVTPPLFNVPVIWRSAPPATPAQAAVVDRAVSHNTLIARTTPAGSESQVVPFPADEATPEPTLDLRTVPEIAPTGSAPQTSHSALSRVRTIAAKHWRGWLLGAWAASTAVLGAMTLGRVIRFRRFVRQAAVPGPDITAQIEFLSKRLGIRRVPGVRFILGSPPPMVLALFCRAELVIPIDLWKRLDDRQRQTLLLHELAHLRRRDHWVRYLELLATCFYWWHFATWLARRALHEAEEHCCDAWVVWAMPDSSRAYMTTLLDAVEFLSRPAGPRLAAAPVLASGMGQFHNLQRRLTMVRERNVERRLGGRGLAAVALLAAMALPLGARVASGDGRGAAQDRVAASAGPDIATAQSNVMAAAERPEDVGAGLPAPAGQQPAATDRAAAGPAFAQAFGQSSFDRSAQPQETVARLEAELAAARQNVERLQKQLEIARGRVQGHRGRSREARLGQIIFKYQDAGSGGSVLAFDGPTRKLLWTLDVPLNAESGIRCYDDETLLIRSADGCTRLVGAWDGKVIRVWSPGVEAPNIDDGHQVNPFGTSAAAGPAQKPASGTPAASPRKSEDPEQRMERMEESIRRLTDAVERLSRERKQ